MKRYLIFLLALTSFAAAGFASPTPAPNKKQQNSTKQEAKREVQTPSAAVIQSANGWYYDKGSWMHPEGYKYVDAKIIRTTARPGGFYPQPPGKLALQNPDKLTPAALAASGTGTKTSGEKTAADKAAAKARNLEPRPSSQTGTHL